MTPISKTERGVVVCPKFESEGKNFSLNSDIQSSDLRRYILYWDKLAYAYPNGLGKPNLDALHDLRYLFEIGILQLHDIPVSTRDIGKDEVPTPGDLSNVPHLISTHNPTPDNPSGMYILGTPAFVWPELSTYAQFQVATHIACNENTIWTVGESNAQLTSAVFPSALSQAIEMTLYASLPIPVEATPLDELIEFRENCREELLQLRIAIAQLRSDALLHPDSNQAMAHAKEALELALIQIYKSLEKQKIKSFFSTLKLYLGVSDSTLVTTLLGAGGAAATSLPLSVGIAAGLAANTILTFADRHFSDSRGLPSELSDFAYVYDLNEYWPNERI